MKRIALLLVALVLTFALAVSLAEEGTAAITVIETTTASTTREGVEIPTYVTLPADFDAEKEYPMAVCIHGHHGNHNEWGGYDAVTNGVAENGIIAVTLDFAGCGASTEGYENNAMPCMCADVLDVVNAMKAQYKISKIGVMGYSMGGRIVCQMMAEDMLIPDTIVFVAPAVAGDVMINACGGIDTWNEGKQYCTETGEMYSFMGPYGEQLLSLAYFEGIEAYGDELASLAAAKYQGNSLMICADNDTSVPVEDSLAVAELFGSTILRTNLCGHSYSFYGTDTAVNNALNAGIITFFTNELVAAE